MNKRNPNGPVGVKGAGRFRVYSESDRIVSTLPEGMSNRRMRRILRKNGNPGVRRAASQ